MPGPASLSDLACHGICHPIRSSSGRIETSSRAQSEDWRPCRLAKKISLKSLDLPSGIDETIMCEDKRHPANLLMVKSLTELASGKKCCAVNNGKPHHHCLKAENQRREKVHIRGNVTTRSPNKQLDFTQAGRTGPDWDVDFLAYGQQITEQRAAISIGTVHSSAEDIEAQLEYEYDDPFSSGYTSFSLTIPVKL